MIQYTEVENTQKRECTDKKRETRHAGFKPECKSRKHNNIYKVEKNLKLGWGVRQGVQLTRSAHLRLVLGIPEQISVSWLGRSITHYSGGKDNGNQIG